jgi:hypothetical protein
MAEWPTLGAICADCRTAVPVGAPCPSGPTHRVLDLSDQAGREALRDTVWGSPSRRRTARQAATAGASGGTAGGLAECADLGSCDISGCDGGAMEGEAAAIIIGIIIAAIAIIILYFIIRAITRWIRKRRNRPKANGASRRARWVGSARGRAGVVHSEHTATTPAGDRECVAYGAALRNKGWFGRGETMLITGATLGFEVELDDGQRARIPAGPVTFDLRGAGWDRVDAEEVAGLLATVNPAGDFDPEHALFPLNRLQLRSVAPGDRVEVVANLEPVPDPEAQHHGGYREAPPTILVPRGPIKLRLA